MALAWGPWARAAVVLVTPLVVFAAVLGMVSLLGAVQTPGGYYQTSVSVPHPDSCNNGTPPLGTPISQTFHGVKFTLQFDRWCELDGPLLNGTVVEGNGTILHFGLSTLMQAENLIWFSPGRSCGVEWYKWGVTVILLVAVE